MYPGLPLQILERISAAAVSTQNTSIQKKRLEVCSKMVKVISIDHSTLYKEESKQTYNSKFHLVLETALAFNVNYQNTNAHGSNSEILGKYGPTGKTALRCSRIFYSSFITRILVLYCQKVIIIYINIFPYIAADMATAGVLQQDMNRKKSVTKINIVATNNSQEQQQHESSSSSTEEAKLLILAKVAKGGGGKTTTTTTTTTTSNKVIAETHVSQHKQKLAEPEIKVTKPAEQQQNAFGVTSIGVTLKATAKATPKETLKAYGGPPQKTSKSPPKKPSRTKASQSVENITSISDDTPFLDDTVNSGFLTPSAASASIKSNTYKDTTTPRTPSSKPRAGRKRWAFNFGGSKTGSLKSLKSVKSSGGGGDDDEDSKK
jgi:hypothetical protein